MNARELCAVIVVAALAVGLGRAQTPHSLHP